MKGWIQELEMFGANVPDKYDSAVTKNLGHFYTIHSSSVMSNLWGRFFQNFLAFSHYLNFTKVSKNGNSLVKESNWPYPPHSPLHSSRALQLLVIAQHGLKYFLENYINFSDILSRYFMKHFNDLYNF